MKPSNIEEQNNAVIHVIMIGSQDTKVEMIGSILSTKSNSLTVLTE